MSNNLVHAIIRSRRKSVALVITEEARLVIRAPFHVPHIEIERLVVQKMAWIERKQAEIASRPKPLIFSPQEKEALKKTALEKISARCQFYAALTGYQPFSVKITSAKKRWGSCGPKGNLNFSWRLGMAPLPVIDYVVVHELVHIVERNHARGFWSKVGSILPDYKSRRKWLKQNGHLLAAPKWAVKAT